MVEALCPLGEFVHSLASETVGTPIWIEFTARIPIRLGGAGGHSRAKIARVGFANPQVGWQGHLVGPLISKNGDNAPRFHLEAQQSALARGRNVFPVRLLKNEGADFPDMLSNLGGVVQSGV